MILQFIEDNYTRTTQIVLDELISELDRIDNVTTLVEELNSIIANMIDVSVCKYDIQTSIYTFTETVLLEHSIVIDTNTITYSYIRDVLITLRNLRTWNDIHSPTVIDVMSDEDLEDINIFGHIVNIFTTADPNCVSDYIVDILPGVMSEIRTMVENLEELGIDDGIISREFNDCVSSMPENLMTTNIYRWLLTKLTLDITYEDLMNVFISLVVDNALPVSETVDELRVLLNVVKYNNELPVTTNILINIESTLDELLYSNRDIDRIIGELNDQK